MKYLIFLLFAGFAQVGISAQTVSGFIGKSGSNLFLIPQNSTNYYALVAGNDDVKESLDRLGKGDFITGQGALDTINKKLTVSSINYVGLRKLLGRWVGGDGMMVFKDFSRMKFSPRLAQNSTGNIPNNYQKEFRYTLSPSDGSEWALFLSDGKSTMFATVEFDAGKTSLQSEPLVIRKSTILMKIYESESGNIIRTLKLERP
ncbi:MAG: hypothetical protein H7326_10075 [Bdellovibrionaceae bacterium]|nr:hypothetical protein [Pseudobdellovibrionaceae bacterium]